VRPDGLLTLLRTWLDRNFFSLAASPGFVLLVVITGVPLAAAIFLSFTTFNPASFSFHWDGLGNYKSDLSSSGIDIKNTYIFVGLGITVGTVVGVLVAALLAQRVRGIGAFRAIYALPLLVATIASAVTWHALFDPTSGWVDYFYFLHLAGLGQPVWLADPHTAMLSVVSADAWSGIPTVTFIVLAGMLSLPPDPLEAARIDGSSALQTFLYVKLPALRPVLAFAVLYRLLSLFQQFVLFQVMPVAGQAQQP
jgi:multiple sugar transport system permease protein